MHPPNGQAKSYTIRCRVAAAIRPHGGGPQSKEERKKNGEKSGRSMVELKIGIHGLTEEEKTVNRKKGAAAQHGQRWQCTITGFVSTPTGIAKFQKNRGIDPSNRIRIK